MEVKKRGEEWIDENGELVTVVQNDIGNIHSPTTIIRRKGKLNTVPQSFLVSKTETNYTLKSYGKKLVHNINKTKKCQVVYINFGNNKKSSVQSGFRPAVILKNGKNYLAIPLTSKKKNRLPTHVFIPKKCGLEQNSLVLCEQIFTIPQDEICFDKTIVTLNKHKTTQIKEALYCSLGIKGD